VSSRSVFGEQEAVVTRVKPFDLHGVSYDEAILLIPDRSMEATSSSR
jgi:hypothetical protein